MIDPAQLGAVVDDLGLGAAGENWFVGEVNGVPLALNIGLSDVAATLLFHVRHPLKVVASEEPPVPANLQLAKMVAEELSLIHI